MILEDVGVAICETVDRVCDHDIYCRLLQLSSFIIFYKVRLADSQGATVRQLQEGKVQSEII